MTCGVDATISCTNSPGTKPLKVTLTSPPADNELSAIRGVVASGKATTTAAAGGATVVASPGGQNQQLAEVRTAASGGGKT
jgi:hypothetical protein